jgi:two-component system, LytTR family, response regulator
LTRACVAVRGAADGELGRRLRRLLGELPARLVVRVADRAVVIDPREVVWIEADSYYAKIHVAGAAHLLRESLTSLEERLDPERFVRTHRSAIVNVELVREVGRTDLGLADGTRVPLARDRRNGLIAHLARRGQRR